MDLGGCSGHAVIFPGSTRDTQMKGDPTQFPVTDGALVVAGGHSLLVQFQMCSVGGTSFVVAPYFQKTSQAGN